MVYFPYQYMQDPKGILEDEILLNGAKLNAGGMVRAQFTSIVYDYFR